MLLLLKQPSLVVVSKLLQLKVPTIVPFWK